MRIDTHDASSAIAVPRHQRAAAAPAEPSLSRALEVTVDGATRRFEQGSTRNALVGPLTEVERLGTRITSDGRLQFITDDARQLVIGEIMADAPGYAEAVLDSLFSAVAFSDDPSAG